MLVLRGKGLPGRGSSFVAPGTPGPVPGEGQGSSCLLDPVISLSREVSPSAAAPLLCAAATPVPRPRLSLTRRPLLLSVLVRFPPRAVPDLCLHRGTSGPISSERRLLSAGVLPVFPAALISLLPKMTFLFVSP